jgi:NAD(P)-dependent dehydrogenase (short-subunit alcohol dehydrogenase family)
VRRADVAGADHADAGQHRTRTAASGVGAPSESCSLSSSTVFFRSIDRLATVLSKWSDHGAPSPPVAAAGASCMAVSFDLTGRTAVVVGGTTGIGRALALGLADAGADVVATGRRANIVEEVAAAIESRGRRTLRVASDVADAASLHRLRDACVTGFGHVDIVVAAAGVTRRVATLEMTDADWSQILETNLTGMLRTYQAFAPGMIAQRRGRLIGIGSLASFVGLMEVAAYTASKAGVAGLTRALAVEWAPHGVTVNAIAPGVFETDLNREILKGPRGQEFLTRTPMRRFGRTEELVGAAVYLASDAASFVTGQLLVVDGGLLASAVNV